MRIATWNLERPAYPHQRRAVRQMECMQAIAADICVLTETHECVRPDNLPHSVATTGTDRPGAAGERWAMVWSRYPIVEQIPTRDPIRTVCARVAVPGVREWIVYATVLPWRNDRRWKPRSYRESFDAVVAEQQAELKHLRDHYPECRVCMTGDFNQEFKRPFYVGTADGQSRVSAMLEDLGCRWVTGELDPLANHKTLNRQSIDHICLNTSEAKNVVGCGVWPTPGAFYQVPLSDHFGIWVELAD